MSIKEDRLSYVRICALLEYDSAVGILRWKVRPGNVAFNNRFAGKQTGSTESSTGHLVITIDRERYYTHRVIWCYYYGEWPRLSIDHIDRDPSNNRIINLRSVSTQANGRNCKIAVNSLSGVTGVYEEGSKKHPWKAGIKVEGRSVHLGYFKFKYQAITARREAERRYGFIVVALLKPNRFL